MVPGHNQGIQTLARDHIYPSKQSVGSYDVYFNLYYQKRELRVFFYCIFLYFSTINIFYKEILSKKIVKVDFGKTFSGSCRMRFRSHRYIKWVSNMFSRTRKISRKQRCGYTMRLSNYSGGNVSLAGFFGLASTDQNSVHKL